MKILAILVSLFVLLGYSALMRIDPTWGLFHPRGGLVILAISLVFANIGIWLAAQTDRSQSARFQFAAAGWIWLAVQGGGLAYLYSQSGGA